MPSNTDFSRDWLRLREGADLAARDPVLARRFGAALAPAPGRPVRLVDLGAGSGANCRALLPRIAGDQDWLLIDRDRALIAAQAEEFTIWARRQGYPIRAGGGQIIIDGGAGQWRMTSLPLDLAKDRTSIEELAADGITTAALLDLVSRDWIDWLADLLARRALPLLAALTVDGTRRWQPRLDADAIVAASFSRHQSRDKGFGPALGGAAPQALAAAVTARGLAVSAAASDWTLDKRNAPLLAALIAGEAQAGAAATPEHAAAIEEWHRQRLEQLAEGKLGLTIGHRDMLALPG
jgi:hypothetical protein